MKIKNLFFYIIVITFVTFFCLPTSSAVILPSLSIAKSVDESPYAKNNQIRIAQMKLFTSITSEEYGKLIGHKLNFVEKISFKLSQHRMRKMLKQYEYGDGPTTLSKISWLLKGLLLGPIALIIGYLFLKDDDRELIKWIWFGFAGFAILAVVLLLTL